MVVSCWIVATAALGQSDRGRPSVTHQQQASGQDVTTILHLVHHLIHDEEDEEDGRDKASQPIQNVAEQGHMALLGHSLAAYISVLDRERLRKLTTRILSDTTLWLCRIFRYDNGSAYFHEDDRDGLVKVCRLAINARYEEYTTEGYAVLSSRQPVIYQSASCRPGLGQHLCNQLGLPLSSLCTVPCNTIFGSQHQMVGGNRWSSIHLKWLSEYKCDKKNTFDFQDVALLDKLIKEDTDAGKLPLLLIANAGTPEAGHTDKLSRLKELCDQHGVFLGACSGGVEASAPHVRRPSVLDAAVTVWIPGPDDICRMSSSLSFPLSCQPTMKKGTLEPTKRTPWVNLATLALAQVTSAVMGATRSDSMTLTPGRWLGLPAVTAVTLYRHEDPALSLAAGLTSSQPVEKLRALPLWLSLQYLGHNGIVQKIRHAAALSQHLLLKLKSVTCIRTSGMVSQIPPISGASLRDILGSVMLSIVGGSGGSVDGLCAGEKEVLDTFNRWMGEQLAQLVPSSGVDVVELEDEGTCVRFSPLLTAAVLGTQQEDVDEVVQKLLELVPMMSATMNLRQDFREETHRHAPSLTYIEELSWPGLGAEYGVPGSLIRAVRSLYDRCQSLVRIAGSKSGSFPHVMMSRYESQAEGADESRRKQEQKKINDALLTKLQELDTDIVFSTGPEFATEENCIFVGMVTDDVDVSELVHTISTLGRDIEESGRILENMTERVRKGILEAELQLQKANEEKLLEEGMLRQLPVVGSVLNWFSPVESSIKGRTFNLAAGTLLTADMFWSRAAQYVDDV
ncbi:hypothetical protein CCH79_00015717 [Gambusia affinis]|uniref:Pyridoxal-dependent decarboxylase domain-containing protein 1 n=1 Tax=Gambusia affinis TaxID=33528 RepID=A0A315W5X9_GAMAF|nr:hypothetical protein CCH79_00015717 [Gambusia affinis]